MVVKMTVLKTLETKALDLTLNSLWPWEHE